MSRIGLLIAVVLTGGVARAETGLAPLSAYPLPAEAQSKLEKFAAETDVLVFGESHGTQEVAQLAATLLAPLDKLGYKVLALEVTVDQQQALTDWATGKSTTVPSFYAAPGHDGRGSIQMLTLIRTALSPPYAWKLVCFDASEVDGKKRTEEMQEEKKKLELYGKHDQSVVVEPVVAKPGIVTDQDILNQLWAEMRFVAHFAGQLQESPKVHKVLALCGSIHARTADHTSREDPISLLWPTFCALLADRHPDWRIKSVYFRFHSGELFYDGKTYPQWGPAIDQAGAKLLDNGDWNMQLDLPKCTPATYLARPKELIEELKESAPHAADGSNGAAAQH